MSVDTFEYASKPTTQTIATTESTATNTTPGPLPKIMDGISSDSRTNSATSYIYQYGIKNIGLSNSLYQPTGVFVTKPMEIEGNVVEVSLSTFEDHPLFNELDGMATDRVTSIEYYLAVEENPSANDWLPILPEKTTNIKAECLFFTGSSARLLFNANIADVKNTKVYKNHMVMNDEDWYFTEHGASIQLAVPYDQNSIYTIDYVPDSALSNPWSISIENHHSKRIRKVEEFPNGTDSNNTIKLSKYPFIDYTQINQVSSYDPNTSDYRPFDVFITDGTIAAGDGQIQKEFYPVAYANQDEFITKNMTDYQNSTDAALKKYSIDPDSPYKVFEYKQEKDKLVFTESFNRSDFYYNEASNHGNGKIVVHYDYLVTNFRLKIILRKNSGDELVISPIADSYQLKFKVMK